jgi:sec-independent protein translocase protein TatB
MTGVGFFELLLIGVVGLIILGPDKLPGALRTAALWIGRFRRSFDNIKREIEKEVGADEIRRQLRNEAIMEKFNESKKKFDDTIESARKDSDSVKQSLDLKQQILNSGKEASGKTESSGQATANGNPSNNQNSNNSAS